MLTCAINTLFSAATKKNNDILLAYLVFTRENIHLFFFCSMLFREMPQVQTHLILSTTKVSDIKKIYVKFCSIFKIQNKYKETKILDGYLIFLILIE